jgi:hypothetical protein
MKDLVVKGKFPDLETYVTLNLPTNYDENATHFRVSLDMDGGNEVERWFELIDESNTTKTYAQADFDKPLPIEAPMKKLRIYHKHGLVLKSVLWTTNDPKSWNTGTQRVVRDNHYAENLQTLSTRNFETPDTANATTGFRLVRRP